MQWLIILFSFPSLALALETQYIWNIQNDDITSGKCYEVDVATLGKKYIKKIDARNCRPQQTDYVFEKNKGFCYEVDHATQGKKYLKKAKSYNCRPQDTIYKILSIKDKTRCYLVDKETLGQKYYERAQMSDCKDDDYMMMWEPNSSGTGRCYRVVTVGTEQHRTSVNKKECKPKKTVFIFKRKSEFSGQCFEVHPDDPKKFSMKSKTENCRPADTIFVFYKHPTKAQGNCYEIDEATKGDQYLKKVSLSKCK
jgi:Zn ribbon nucleic-acid-binding protein